MLISETRESNISITTLAAPWNVTRFLAFTSHTFGANPKHSILSRLVVMALYSFNMGTICEGLYRRRSWPWFPGKYRMVSIFGHVTAEAVVPQGDIQPPIPPTDNT